MSAGVAFVDGAYVPVEDARVPILDWGFLRSDATYDVVHVRDGAFFRLADHVERFRRGMERLRLSLPERTPPVDGRGLGVGPLTRRIRARYWALHEDPASRRPSATDLRLCGSRIRSTDASVGRILRVKGGSDAYSHSASDTRSYAGGGRGRVLGFCDYPTAGIRLSVGAARNCGQGHARPTAGLDPDRAGVGDDDATLLVVRLGAARHRGRPCPARTAARLDSDRPVGTRDQRRGASGPLAALYFL